MPWLKLKDLNSIQEIIVSKQYEAIHGQAQAARDLMAMQWEVDESGNLLPAAPQRRPATEYYDPAWENKVCECGHPYHRHFDSYSSDNEIYGCKYCPCYEFKEKT